MKKSVLIFLLIIPESLVYGQTRNKFEQPEVNKPCPDFVLSDIDYFYKKRIAQKDFRGKWLVLDFWNRYCSGCISKMPEINALSNKLGDKVQFMLVGYTGSAYSGQSDSKAIQALYEKVRQKYKLNLSIAYDSVLFQQFNISRTPFIIIIDPKGIVRGITCSLSSEVLENLVAGIISEVPNIIENISYNKNLPLLTYENGGSDTNFLYRSLLSAWNPSMPTLIPPRIDLITKGRFEVARASIELLYKFAFIGKYEVNYSDSLHGKLYPFLVIEVHDSSLFKTDLLTGRNYFCYSLIVPPSKGNKRYLMQLMQQDLKNYFGYDVNIETRKMPYWALTATNMAKDSLKTKGGAASNGSYSHIGFTAKNVPIQYLIGNLSSYFQSYQPFIDESGINGNIDITVDALLTDFDDYRNGLQKNGLFLQKKEKDIGVIVIRDSKK